MSVCRTAPQCDADTALMPVTTINKNTIDNFLLFSSVQSISLWTLTVGRTMCEYHLQSIFAYYVMFCIFDALI